MEVEFIGAPSAAQEAIWLKCFIWNLEVVQHALDPIILHCGSMVATGHANYTKCHVKTKDIDVKFNFIKNWSEEVTPEYIPIECMVVDLLTKSFDCVVFESC